MKLYKYISLNHYPITQTCNYIIVHFSRFTFFLCLRLAGGRPVSADRFGQSPNSIADIVGQDPQDGAMYVSSKLDRFKGLAEPVSLASTDKKIRIYSARVSVDMYGSLCHKVYRS